jgi:hypothetical protein
LASTGTDPTALNVHDHEQFARGFLASLAQKLECAENKIKHIRNARDAAHNRLVAEKALITNASVESMAQMEQEAKAILRSSHGQRLEELLEEEQKHCERRLEEFRQEKRRDRDDEEVERVNANHRQREGDRLERALRDTRARVKEQQRESALLKQDMSSIQQENAQLRAEFQRETTRAQAQREKVLDQREAALDQREIRAKAEHEQSSHRSDPALVVSITTNTPVDARTFSSRTVDARTVVIAPTSSNRPDPVSRAGLSTISTNSLDSWGGMRMAIDDISDEFPMIPQNQKTLRLQDRVNDEEDD